MSLFQSIGKSFKHLAALTGGFTALSEEFYGELEEALIAADVGFATTQKLIDALRRRVRQQSAGTPEEVRGILRALIAETLTASPAASRKGEGLRLILMVGVNGVGKTTTIGKLAAVEAARGGKVILAAGDTFRAAAVEQLQIWGERTGAAVIRHSEGADPAAVVYDAISAAKARGADLIICDTAGRLHNRKNLMDELAKIRRVIDRELPASAVEVLLVVDATTGQNAVSQAKLFKEVAGINGIVLTKLDGTAKGGVVIAIAAETGVPVRYVGVGESVGDLIAFDPEAFAGAIFGGEES
jgi:fused signal recognition particle receptor